MNSGCYNREGTTFVEVMIAILVLSVMSVGTLGYQYFAITNVETAKAEWVAVRTGQLVLEDWRSRGAMSGYDPSGLGMGFVQTDDDGGEYVITVDGVNMYLSLSYGDVDT